MCDGIMSNSTMDKIILNSNSSRSIESPIGDFFACVQGQMPRAEHATYCVYPWYNNPAAAAVMVAATAVATAATGRLVKAPRRVYTSSTFTSLMTVRRW